MTYYTQKEISDATGFDHGELFDSDDEVNEYFSPKTQRALFGNEVVSSAELAVMRNIVLENRWHMKTR